MMKKVLVLFILSALALPVTTNAQGVLHLEGNYQGKNLYVQNPYASSGVGFCVYEVLVNGEISVDEWNSSAFEIDLSVHQLNIGDPVTVTIKHKDGCTPKVLNPQILKPKSTFEVGSMEIGKDGMLKWCTTKESGKLDFIIEQYRWNKWVKVGEVAGQGTPTENCYEFKITPHSGENQIRLKQVDYTGRPRYSTVKKFRDPTIKEVTFNPKKVSKEIIFSSETLYEIYDQYGNIVKRGYGANIPCENLKKGIYYLNYDNSTDSFIKK